MSPTVRFGLCVLATAILSLCACSHPEATDIMPDDLSLMPGDIVFRRGTGITSRIVVGTDVKGLYSHVGIVVDTDSGLMVAHAVPDEPDFPGDVDRVKVESPGAFFSNLRAQIGAVARYRNPEIARKASDFAIAAFDRHALFDHNYDDSDTVNLYCCQLVTLAYEKAGIILVVDVHHHVSFPGVIDVNCRFPSDIYNSPSLEVIYTF